MGSRLFIATVAASMLAADGAVVQAQSAPAQATAASPPRQAATERNREAHPDLSGVWQILAPAAWNLLDHQAADGVPAGQGIVVGNEIPYQPWARDKRRENFQNRAQADPEKKCYLPGVPRLTLMPFPFQIFQSDDLVLMIHEYARAIRHVHTDGTAHPHGPLEFWLGDSRGKWDGNTLVVDTVHFTDQTWLDRSGNFHSEALHVVERFTPDGPDHLRYQARLEDPKVFTRPWEIETVLYRRKDKNAQILEYNCYGFEFEGLYP